MKEIKEIKLCDLTMRKYIMLESTLNTNSGLRLTLILIAHTNVGAHDE